MAPGTTAPGPPLIRPAQVTADAPERTAHLLVALATRISATLDLQVVLDESFAALRQLVDFGGGAIQLIEDGCLVAAATDPPMAPEARTVRIPVGTGVSGTIAATGEPIYIADITVDPRVHPDGRAKGVSNGVRSYFGVPLIARGAPIGVLQIDAPTVDGFVAEDRALVLAFSPAISAAVQNAVLFEQERRATERLREADRLKQDFLSIVSHELRTPLTSMMGFADTLAKHIDRIPPDQAADLARRITGAGERLERIIGDLLYVSQIERGFVRVQLAPVSLARAIALAIDEAVDLDHPTRVDIPDEPLRVLADAHRLHQVLTNLLGNAAKFSPPGEPIQVRVRPTADRIEVDIEDRGRGVPQGARDEIFRLFYQAENATTRSAGGLGVGLYVAKRLCDAMGATLSLSSPAEGGTRMTISLSRAEPR